MIASIRFSFDGVEGFAVLGRNCVWTCEEFPVVASVLNELHSPRDDGPADGIRGHAKAHDANKWLKGELYFPPTTPAPTGCNY